MASDDKTAHAAHRVVQPGKFIKKYDVVDKVVRKYEVIEKLVEHRVEKYDVVGKYDVGKSYGVVDAGRAGPIFGDAIGVVVVPGGARRHVEQAALAEPRTVAEHEAALRAVHARRELAAIEEAARALAASDAGLTQRQLAAQLGRSQTDVHRLLRRARAGMPSEVWKLILKGVAGEISRGTMVGSLKPGLLRGEKPAGEQVDGYAPGGLDEVRAAFMEGFLTEAEYDEIRGAASRAEQ